MVSYPSPSKPPVQLLGSTIAVREGKLEYARGRGFSGNYKCLAFKDSYLWGLDADRKQICKIQVTD